LTGNGMRRDEHAMIVSGMCLGWLHYTTTMHCVVLAQKDRERNQTFDMTNETAEPPKNISVMRDCLRLWCCCISEASTLSVLAYRPPSAQILRPLGLLTMQDMLGQSHLRYYRRRPQMLQPSTLSALCFHFRMFHASHSPSLFVSHSNRQCIHAMLFRPPCA